MQRILIAFGGNALLRSGDDATYDTQFRRARSAFQKLAEIIQENEIIISHGNGPQVGNILLQNEAARETVRPMPLHGCGAMSQGIIGEILVNAYDSVRIAEGISKEAATIVTRTLVDENDPAFGNPTKPIGPYYTKAEAEKLIRFNGWKMREERGKGFRRLVPSPQPIDILERNAIFSLLNDGFMPIASGGGGIPVARSPSGYVGVDAVIDKDLASSFLASILEADRFIILTDVDNAVLNFGTESARPIGRITASDLEKYYNSGQFPSGSMGPKVKAALDFVKRTGKVASIGSLDRAKQVLSESSGTIVVPG
ncbi:MAG: carbamate kinase [Thermoplasmataceae archaeon]